MESFFFFSQCPGEMAQASGHSLANLEEMVNDHFNLSERQLAPWYIFPYNLRVQGIFLIFFFLILTVWSVYSVNTEKYFQQLRKVCTAVPSPCPSHPPGPFGKSLDLPLEQDALESFKENKECDPV